VDKELQHTSTTCNTLERIATQELRSLWNCNTLQRPTTQYNSLQHSTTHCNTGAVPFVDGKMQHTVTTCNTLERTATQELRSLWSCNTLQRPTARYNSLQHSTTHCNTGATPLVDGKMQRTATTCNTLERTATQELRSLWSCNTLQRPTTQYNTLQQHTATHCNTRAAPFVDVELQHTATTCITLKHTTICYNTLQCRSCALCG